MRASSNSNKFNALSRLASATAKLMPSSQWDKYRFIFESALILILLMQVAIVCFCLMKHAYIVMLCVHQTSAGMKSFHNSSNNILRDYGIYSKWDLYRSTNFNVCNNIDHYNTIILVRPAGQSMTYCADVLYYSQ